MSCGKIRVLLGAYRDGELSPAEAGEVSEHLAVCAGCRELSRQIGRMSELIQVASDETAPPFFEARFWSAVTQSNARGWTWRLPVPARGALVTAGVMALAATFLLPMVLKDGGAVPMAGIDTPDAPGEALLALGAGEGQPQVVPTASGLPAVPESWGEGTRVEGYWAREPQDGTYHRYLVGEVSDGSRLQRVRF